MNPRKAKTLIPAIAKETGCSEELVQAITSFFWEDVRKAVVDLRAPQIYVEKLGTFVIKDWKLPETEAQYVQQLENYRKKTEENRMTFQKFASQKDTELRLEKLRNVIQLSNENKLKRKQVKAKRYEFLDNTGKNLQEPKTDL